MREIPLTQGKFALVDDEDYDRLVSRGSWFFQAEGYAVRNERRPGGGQQMVKMHRLIMNAPDGFDVDHINNDKLDNRRVNLRLCSRAQNCRNRGPQANNPSGLKGVFFDRQHRRWTAQIRFDQRRYFLGRFTNPFDAAAAYDRAAKQHFGEFAWLNGSTFVCPVRLASLAFPTIIQPPQTQRLAAVAEPIPLEEILCCPV
ncbi:HNH endonuclease [Botrimarina mediterranea]|uniref:AP2 domain protein n=1 Tax=Botrimarina mediterranea TaxID=2528022 RepID=A0A518K3W5_9BACT|nr:HNH endonuclease [Botrimarina mediterranea]QDV72476.1 AP2 domain protein [Botrimarina mediterranea]QDV77046.1 AP2 domain protein [Planctomycetes bacterium K2D]